MVVTWVEPGELCLGKLHLISLVAFQDTCACFIDVVAYGFGLDRFCEECVPHFKMHHVHGKRVNHFRKGTGEGKDVIYFQAGEKICLEMTASV
jgi:hypothetical protein